MVGVPGRSKGCITCRQRRKGCDLAKPTCDQCNRAGLTCAGYTTDRVFVISTPTSRKAGYRADLAPGQAASRSLSTSYTTTHRLLSRPEEEHRCINLFWEAYFPTGRPIPSSVVRSFTCAWTETARTLYRDNGCLKYALWANCLFVTAGGDEVEWMRREASKSYGRSLADLRRSLMVPQQGPARRDALIATMKLLSMFEALTLAENGPANNEADDPADWQRHQAGEMALFIARTPTAHIAGESHYIFADERVDMAMSAILQRKRFVLGNPEWKSAPWQQIPKDLKDVLVDVLVDMPDLVVLYDTMVHCQDNPSHQERLRAELHARCWESDRQLEAWFAAQEAGDDKESSGQDHLITYVAQVHGMIIYWTTALVLYTILRNSLPRHEQPSALPPRTDPLPHAKQLVRSLTELLKPSAGLYGRQNVVLPLEITWRFVRDWRVTGLDAVNVGVDTKEEIRGLIEGMRKVRERLR
ncbi:uncharacterized protein C8A04DRAFT_13701 [Dichotomopilus funicola]|uniref:Zn(2)-C6 fungal-type domain-containing protein n=1 Tax=Dichotomopilus funicola TaxID=1934379 RepID=A0AAN6UZG9_9PEZI|nr:hypothetical protein C8A04DRAFT_13701 [Dichotomopilus funicola]